MIKKLKFKANEEKALKRLKEEIFSRFGVIDFRIFGSKVRTQGDPESNINVFLMLDERNSKVE